MEVIKNFIQFCIDILNQHFWIVVTLIFYAFGDIQFAMFSFGMACYFKLCDLVDYFYDDDDSQTVEELAAKEAKNG